MVEAVQVYLPGVKTQMLKQSLDHSEHDWSAVCRDASVTWGVASVRVASGILNVQARASALVQQLL